MLASKESFHPSPPGVLKDDDVDMASASRDGSLTKGDSPYRREPEDPSARSPGSDTRETASKDIAKGENLEAMDTGSPPRFPKHVIVPSPEALQRPVKVPKKSASSQPSQTVVWTNKSNNIVTPILRHEAPGGAPQSVYGRLGYGPPSFPEITYGAPYAPAPEMELGTSYDMMNSNIQLRPKRWACDYCCVATFLSYEAACVHEEQCKRRHGNHQGASPHNSYGAKSPGMSPYGPGLVSMQHQGSPILHSKQLGGLGALYQAVQEVQQGAHPEGTLPRAGGTPSVPSEPVSYPTLSPRFHIPTGPDYERIARCSFSPSDREQRRMLLALPSDADSLSDRQCFVRSDFVEVFAATDKEVAARHSKGAQKLVMGQVGIRCVHCAHLRPKDRAERAVCYPSSISRIYQTVADMQRFHFEQCREIPEETRTTYKTLKTTRPRGVGSPQEYWIESAKQLNLVDSKRGIRFADDPFPAKSE